MADVFCNADTGEAEAIFRRAEATARGLDEVSRAIGSSDGASAAAYELAEQYVAAFKVRDMAVVYSMQSELCWCAANSRCSSRLCFINMMELVLWYVFF